VGDEPFAVMLGDDIMSEGSTLLNDMCAAQQRFGRSVIALKEVSDAEISLYGSVRADEVDPPIVRVEDIIEKPTLEEAPSNLAVMGRYIFTPEIFDALERVQPGKGGEIQLTDAIGLLLKEQEVYGYCFTQGRYDIGNKLDYLRATVELALERDDLGPPFADFLRKIVERRAAE
jgi:UTP--glucose-1-phosphate uridylyltransferase